LQGIKFFYALCPTHVLFFASIDLLLRQIEKYLMPDFQQTVGVVGAGTFGTAIANLLSRKVDVLLYSRNAETIERINLEHQNFGVKLSPRVSAIGNLQELAEKCTLIFPVVPSDGFRSTMQGLGPFLRPYHILIHGTKGFDVKGINAAQMDAGLLEPQHISTMSQVITQETVVKRVGCLSGPNLATEILEGQPTATVIGSVYEEVIELGKKVLSSDAFHVFGNHDILGAELAGVLKNVIAIGSGILRGRGLGKNIQAMLITRGLMEMARFGQAMGTTNSAFFGTAGIGDLVATATSKNSRNFTFGYRLGQGEKIQDIQASMPELAEGVRTLKITWHLANYYKLRLPITQMLYNIVFDGYNIDKAIKFLITYPYDVDVDF
jgi:glycerol-3-phosphate dehydrogenase (NAD(P)+)